MGDQAVNMNAYNPGNLNDQEEVWKLHLANKLTSKQVQDWWYGRTQVATVTATTVKLPEHCSECNHHNPYVGPEHIISAPEGPKYVCRQCKPKWERQQSLRKLKAEADASEARRTDYSGTSSSALSGMLDFPKMDTGLKGLEAWLPKGFKP